MADPIPPRGAAPSSSSGPVHNIEHSGFHFVAVGPEKPRRDDAASRARFLRAVPGAVAAALLAIIVLRLTIGPAQVTPIVTAARGAFALSLVVASLFLLARWRFLEVNSSAWLAFGLFTLGVYLQPEAYGPAWRNTVSPVDLLMMLISVFAARAAAADARTDGWRHPLVLGLLASFFLVSMRAVVSQFLLPDPPAWLTTVVFASFLIAVVLCAVAMLRIASLPSALRWHLMVPVAVGAAYFQFLAGPSTTIAIPALAGAMVGAAVTIHTFAAALALMQDGYEQQHHRLTELADRAHEAEAVLDHDEELLHECRATIAGLSAASRLLATSSDRMAQDQVTALQAMVDAEMLRLQAVLADSGHTPVTERSFALDDLLHPLVLSLRAQGVEVMLRPTKLQAWGDQSIVSTAIHVLLCNSKRHAPGAHIEIWATSRRDNLVLHVADNGPGLPAELAGRLFARGARGFDSPGQGLGLYSARKGLRAHGGDLAVVPTTQGARFAVTLPRENRCSA